VAQNGGWGGPKKRDAAILSVPIEAGIKYAKSNMRKKVLHTFSCCVKPQKGSRAEQSSAERKRKEELPTGSRKNK